MARHILGVDVIPTNNDQILHLFDTSAYAGQLEITCPRLEIYVPGFKTPRLLEPIAYFNLAINAITLDLVSPDSSLLPALPDGIYHIKYSISPNDLVDVEFDYLRTTIFEKELFRLRCALDIDQCTPSSETGSKLKLIQEMDEYLKAAVAAVEHCDDVEQGLTLFIYAKKLYERYTHQYC